MASKIERPAAQLAPLALKPGRVIHIDLSGGKLPSLNTSTVYEISVAKELVDDDNVLSFIGDTDVIA